MKAFFERYSYESVRLALNQFAISIFGFSLSLASTVAENNALLLWSSIGAIAFYLFLTYSTAHRTGTGDRLSIRYGKILFRPMRGLWIALIANSFNFIIAILMIIGDKCNVDVLLMISQYAMFLTEGMYTGLLASISVGGVVLSRIWWAYFLIPLPAMLIATLGYVAGAKDFHITKMGVPDLPASDRPSKQELREQRELEKKSRK